MKIVVFSREGRDYSRGVTEFVEMFKRKYPAQDITIKDPDTVESTTILTALGVNQYPAVVVMTSDNRATQLWQGEPLPLSDEVAAFALG